MDDVVRLRPAVGFRLRRLLLTLASTLLVAALPAAHAEDVTSTEDDGTGTLRAVLSSTVDTIVTLTVVGDITLTGEAINPGAKVTALKGQGDSFGLGLKTFVGGLLAGTRNFLLDFLEDPDSSAWNDYFGVDGTFETTVKDAIDTATSTASANTSVIKMGNVPNLTAPVIHDTRGDGASLAYSNVAFKDFKTTLSNNCDGDSSFCGGGVVWVFSESEEDSSASIGDIENSLFTKNTVTVESQYSSLLGGGVVGAFSESEEDPTASIGDIENSFFSGNTVTVTGEYGALFGGGVVGAGSKSSESSSGSASIGDIENSLFTGNTVSSIDSLSGGGVLGAFSNASIFIGAITGSLFTGNTVEASGEKSGLLGGGVVGAISYSEKEDSSISLDAITGSLFAGNTVEVNGYVLSGGGVVGAYSTSKFDFTISLGAITGSLFAGNTVEVNGGFLTGGGVVGAYSEAKKDSTVSIDTIKNSLFIGNTVEVEAGDDAEPFTLLGGGVVGAFSESKEDSSASLVAIKNSLFIGNTVGVEVEDESDVFALTGGGVVGVYSASASASQSTTASLGAITNSLFGGNTVSVNRDLYGGGVVGAASDSEPKTSSAVTVSIGNISDSHFAGNTVSVGENLFGGGVVGAFSLSESSSFSVSICTIKNTLFTGNTVEASGALGGGGVVGVAGVGSASIGDISGSRFTGNTIKVEGSEDREGNGLLGGGVVGVYSGGSVSIGDISNSRFTGNTVTVSDGSLYGGGVLGVCSDSFNTASLGTISNSLFSGNEINSGGVLFGGLIHTADDLTIVNSVFTDNSFTVPKSAGILNKFYGTVSIDTSKTGTGDDPTTHTVTLKASGGKMTLFQNNVAQETNADCESDSSGCTSNSIVFRNIYRPKGESQASAVLKIDTDSGKDTGTVALVDPIWVSLSNDKTFNMTVSGDGEFLWGGANAVENGSANSLIALGNGSDAPVTMLLSEFELKDGKYIPTSGFSLTPMSKLVGFNLNLNERATLLSQVGSEITASTMTLNSNSILAFDLTGAKKTTFDNDEKVIEEGSINLTLDSSEVKDENGELDKEGGIATKVDIHTFSEEGDYRLASFGKGEGEEGFFSLDLESTNPSIRGSRICVDSTNCTRAAGIGLALVDKAQTLVLKEAPQTGTVIWTGEKSMKWDITSQNWDTSEIAEGDKYDDDKHFLYGDDVLFTNEGAGTVDIVATFSILDAMSVTFNHDAEKDYILTGKPLHGRGTTLTKEGGGTLILNTAGNDIKTAKVKEGRLIVGSDADKEAELIAESVSVSVNSLLGGHGTIGSDVIIASGGILSPGYSSYGKLTVVRSLTFKSGSVFDVDIDLSNTNMGDLLEIIGTATLAGTVRVTVTAKSADSSVEDGEWLILSATEGFTGRFGEDDGDKEVVMAAVADLTPTLSLSYVDQYGSDGNPVSEDNPGDGIKDTVYLCFKDPCKGEPGTAGPQTEEPGTTDPEIEEPGTAEPQTEESEPPDPSGGPNAGEAHASLPGVLLTRDDTFIRRLRHHVSGKSLSPSTDNGTWIGVNKSSATLDGNVKSARTTWSGTELFGGYDAKFANGGIAGLAFRLEEGQQEVDDRRSEAEIISGTASLYGGKELPAGPGSLRVLLAGAITRHDIESKRHVQIVTRNQKLKTHYSGRTTSASLEAAYRVSSPEEKLSVEPYVALTHHRLSLDGFTEKGGTAALKKDKETETQTQSTLGLRLSTSPKARVTFDADVGWKHLHGNTPKSRFSFREGSTITTPGAPANKNAALLSLSLGAKITKHAQLRLQYDGELGSRGQSHEGQVVFEVKW